MFMFQSDLNFKEIWASLLGKGRRRRRGNGEKSRRVKIRRPGGFRGDDRRGEMKR